jgi:hypothetical protein
LEGFLWHLVNPLQELATLLAFLHPWASTIDQTCPRYEDDEIGSSFLKNECRWLFGTANFRKAGSILLSLRNFSNFEQI